MLTASIWQTPFPHGPPPTIPIHGQSKSRKLVNRRRFRHQRRLRGTRRSRHRHNLRLRHLSHQDQGRCSSKMLPLALWRDGNSVHVWQLRLWCLFPPADGPSGAATDTRPEATFSAWQPPPSTRSSTPRLVMKSAIARHFSFMLVVLSPLGASSVDSALPFAPSWSPKLPRAWARSPGRIRHHWPAL